MANENCPFFCRVSTLIDKGRSTYTCVRLIKIPLKWRLAALRFLSRIYRVRLLPDETAFEYGGDRDVGNHPHRRGQRGLSSGE